MLTSHSLPKQGHEFVRNPESSDVSKFLREARWIIDCAAPAGFKKNSNQSSAGNAKALRRLTASSFIRIRNDDHDCSARQSSKSGGILKGISHIVMRPHLSAREVILKHPHRQQRKLRRLSQRQPIQPEQQDGQLEPDVLQRHACASESVSRDVETEGCVHRSSW